MRWSVCVCASNNQKEERRVQFEVVTSRVRVYIGLRSCARLISNGSDHCFYLFHSVQSITEPSTFIRHVESGKAIKTGDRLRTRSKSELSSNQIRLW